MLVGPIDAPQKSVVITFVEHCVATGSYVENASLEALKRQGGPNTSFERTRDR